MKENWQQVKEILAGVLTLKPEDRSEFVNLHCSGNRDLQFEVESLLSAHDSAESFLESPAVGEVADTFIDDCRHLKEGDFLNHYKIIRKIGAGGMGAVYLAEDGRLERRVAVKILNDTFDTGQSNLKRFFQEAKAASALNHPNIIVVYEIGECDGNHYIAIEFVKGDTLSEVIKRKNLSLVEITDISIQIVNALTAAHEVGIVHRDIKPDNIMLRDDGIVKILDFGLAKLIEKHQSEIDSDAKTRELSNTRAGMILGTASYMSPEQTRGKGVDARTDIWSFGVVLFQMLTGKLPFPGETTSDVIAAILKTELPHLTKFVSDVPPDLERIVGKTLRKNPNARYRTATEILDDLNHFRHELEFGERVEPLNERTNEDFKEENARTNKDFKEKRLTDAKFAAVTANQAEKDTGKFSSFISEAVSSARARPNFLILGLLSFAALMIVGYVGFSKIYSPISPPNSFQNMRLAKLTFDGTTTNITAVSPDGKYIVYALRDEGKQALMVRQVAASSVVQIVAPADVGYYGLKFTPDGNYIYYTVSEGDVAAETLYKIPVLGGSSQKIAEDVGENITVSPDGKMIAFVRARTSLMVADAGGGSQQLLAASAPGEFRVFIEWSPDGKSIMSSVYSLAHPGYHLSEVSFNDGAEKQFVTSLDWLRINGLAWLADKRGIMISGRDTDTQFSQIWFVSYPNGESRRITNDFSTYVGLSLTADNKSLFAVKQERLFNIWNAANENYGAAKKITSEEGKDEGTSGIARTPDGRIVYTVRIAATVAVWIVNADGSGKRQLTFDQSSNYSPAVSPDGRFIVFASDRTGNPNLWRMDMDGGNAVALTNTPEEESSPGFTPDGKWVIYKRNDANNLATIWKLPVDGGNPVQLTETETGHPTVSPDGKTFACDFGEAKPGNPQKLAIFSIEGGKPLKVLDLPLVIKLKFRWSNDGKALIYVNNQNRAYNLWSQTPDDKPPTQLTFFENGQIAQFDPVRNGSGFVLSRGSESSDIVMVSDFK